MNRDAFIYWWPVLARVVGVVGGLAQIAAAFIAGKPADVAGLGFCGALIAAPWVFPADGGKAKEVSNASADAEQA